MNSAKYIADRIRLLIATKQFQVDEVLPSTRTLGKQLGVSFHTVRKAYHMLSAEGILRSDPGRGFVVVRQNTSLNKEERMEKGADRIRNLLEELIGYGLSEDELETLFEEQIRFLEWPDRLESCASVGGTTEQADMIARAIQDQVGVKSSLLTIGQTEKAVNFDALFVPVAYFRTLRERISDEILMLPIIHNFDAEVLIGIVDRAGVQTIGLVTGQEDSIPVFIDELKLSLKFQGSIIAGAVYGKSLPLFVRDTDLILYTPGSSLLVERQLPEKKRIRLKYQIAEYSSNIIRSELWEQ